MAIERIGRTTLCLLLGLTPPCEAIAADAVVLVAGNRGVLAHRLAQELATLGVPVEVAADGRTARGGVLVVLPEREDGEIEVWSGTTRVATIAAREPVEVRVLRVAELVRAMSLDLPASPSAPEPSPAPPAPAPPAAPPPPRSRPPSPTPPAPFVAPSMPPVYGAPRPSLRDEAPRGAATTESSSYFDAGAAVATQLTRAGVGLALVASARAWPHRQVGAGLLAEVGLSSPSIEAREGSASVRTSLYAAQLEIAPLPRHETFGVFVSAGVGLLHFDVSGAAEAPRLDEEATVFAALPYGRLEARLRVTSSLSIAAAALAGPALPPVEVRFVGREVATVGAYGTLAAGVRFEP